jgi:hypothetical protein
MKDELGKEMSEGATIWQEYTRAADAHDGQLLRQWNQSLDTMLIVVRVILFSPSVVLLTLFKGYFVLRSGHCLCPCDISGFTAQCTRPDQQLVIGCGTCPQKSPDKHLPANSRASEISSILKKCLGQWLVVHFLGLFSG